MFSVTFVLSQHIDVDQFSILPLHSNANLEGCTILLIDDEEIILEATRGLLMQWGCSVLIAENLEQALQLLMTQPQLPNAMICDYRLRGRENGATAIQMIRDEFNADIPALLLTGDTSPQQILLLKETGIPVLHKPIRDGELKKALAQLLFLEAQSES
jgi:CheY-like chemotaxis protein